MQSQKQQNDLCPFPRQPIQYHGNPSLCPNQKCWRNWSWMVLRRPTRPSRTSTPKRSPFHYRGLGCKSKMSRNTWSDRQIWPWSTEWSRTKPNRVLPRERTGHSKHLLPITQEKTLNMNITRWSTLKPVWLYSLQPKMEKLYTVSKTRPGADCGSDHELLIAKFRIKLKKVGKTTWPFKYDLNQIPNDYTVEMRNRFKGLDLIESLMNYGQRFVTLFRRQGARPPTRDSGISQIRIQCSCFWVAMSIYHSHLL